MKKLLFAMLLFISSLSHANCMKLQDDGTEAPCEIEAVEEPKIDKVKLCEISVMLSYEAYMKGTSDAKFPNINHLYYMVDYLGDMMIVKHDAKISMKGVKYIALRLKNSGMRLPNEVIVNMIAGEFFTKECIK
jgi:hypothetical protein